MAAVDQAISNKPIPYDVTEAAIALNREIVPVLKAVRAVVNAELRSACTTVGDGVAAAFLITHTLATADVMVQLKDLLTGEIYDGSDGYTIVVSSDSQVAVLAPAPVPVDGLRVSIRV